MNHRPFIPPPVIKSEKKYYLEYETYSHYNYLNSGLACKLRIWHFKSALFLTHKYPSSSKVIDFGCADGCFLPSLSKYFKHVIGIDKKEQFTNQAKAVMEVCNLSNVAVINNKNMKIKDLSTIIGKKADILFLLEVVEHIGDKSNPYESKMKFIEELFLLAKTVVISVPRMTGVAFLLQRVGFRLFGVKNREPISKKDLLKAVFFPNSPNVEALWAHGHIGFNDKKFEHYLRLNFNVERVKRNLFQSVYIVHLD